MHRFKNILKCASFRGSQSVVPAFPKFYTKLGPSPSRKPFNCFWMTEIDHSIFEYCERKLKGARSTAYTISRFDSPCRYVKSLLDEETVLWTLTNLDHSTILCSAAYVSQCVGFSYSNVTQSGGVHKNACLVTLSSRALNANLLENDWAILELYIAAFLMSLPFSHCLWPATIPNCRGVLYPEVSSQHRVVHDYFSIKWWFATLFL